MTEECQNRMKTEVLKKQKKPDTKLEMINTRTVLTEECWSRKQDVSNGYDAGLVYIFVTMTLLEWHFKSKRHFRRQTFVAEIEKRESLLVETFRNTLYLVLF